MKTWLHAHREALMLTLRQFWRRPITALLSVVVIGVGLLFPVGGYIAVANLKVFAGYAGTDPQISVFLARETNAMERAEIERRLRVQHGVAHFRFVAKDAALRELQSRIGSSELLAGLPSNPLPDTFIVTPREPTSMAQVLLAETIRSWPKVAEVDTDAAWSDRLRLLAGTVDIAVVGLGTLVGLTMLAIIFNTIRLQALTRTEEIAVLRLFGATTAYVRRPFLYFGALQGLSGALFAWIVVGGSLLWVEPRMLMLLTTYGLPHGLIGLSLTDSLVLVGCSALVGLIGAGLASGER